MYLNVAEAKHKTTISLLLLNNPYRVQKESDELLYIRFGHSLRSAISCKLTVSIGDSSDSSHSWTVIQRKNSRARILTKVKRLNFHAGTKFTKTDTHISFTNFPKQYCNSSFVVRSPAVPTLRKRVVTIVFSEKSSPRT